jgi:hypothetical protein
MLSYRVSTDQDFVSKLHDKIHLLAPVGETNDAKLLDSSPYPAGFRRDESVMNSSMRVFQDAYCLRDGMGWEGDGGIKNGGFIGALRLSLVFVPVFSVKVVTVNGKVQVADPGEGSIGQLIELGNQDKQDNVLLELIIARELHKLAKKSGKKALYPCSFILPLFLNEGVWQAASRLPDKPSAITNQKAMDVMKQLGVPSSFVSKKLSSGTLTVKAVWGFFTKFQGNKLYDCGKESFQIVAAAKAIIGVVRESLSDFNFYDLDMNFAQMYELFGFMSQLNMANYTAVLAAHDITNVAQLAYLDHHGADAVMRSIADQCARASDRSSVPNELVRLRSAVAAARSSPLGRPLNERFQNFIDHDASFVTILSSSSFFDIVLSKRLSWMGIMPVMLVMAVGNITNIFIDDPNGFFPNVFLNNESLAIAHHSLSAIADLITFLACPMAWVKSPRYGRFMMAAAFVLFAITYTFDYAISVYSAVHSDCVNCYTAVKGIETFSVFQRILLQQPAGTYGIVLWAAFFCSIFGQQYFVQVCLSILILLAFLFFLLFALITRSFFVLNDARSHASSLVIWVTAYVAMKTLQFIGNRRARSIFKLNLDTTDAVYNMLRDSFPVFSSLTSRNHESPTRCCLVVTRRRDSFGMTLVAPLQDAHDTLNTTVPPSFTRSAKIVDIDSFFQMQSIGKQQLLQSHASFESLIRDAEFINFAFQEWVSSWLSNGPDMDKIQRYLYQSADGIDASLCGLTSKLAASPINGTHIRGPVKHVDRSIQKVRIK